MHDKVTGSLIMVIKLLDLLVILDFCSNYNDTILKHHIILPVIFTLEIVLGEWHSKHCINHFCLYIMLKSVILLLGVTQHPLVNDSISSLLKVHYHALNIFYSSSDAALVGNCIATPLPINKYK